MSYTVVILISSLQRKTKPNTVTTVNKAKDWSYSWKGLYLQRSVESQRTAETCSSIQIHTLNFITAWTSSVPAPLAYAFAQTQNEIRSPSRSLSSDKQSQDQGLQISPEFSHCKGLSGCPVLLELEQIWFPLTQQTHSKLQHCHFFWVCRTPY